MKMSIWKRDASAHWWGRTVLETDIHRRTVVSNFLMRRDTFEFLCSKLEPTEEKQPLDVKNEKCYYSFTV